MKTLGISAFMLYTIVAGGCASVPVRYYSLVPTPVAPPTANTVQCCRVIIANVKVPPAADRPEVVVRRSDDQLLVMSNDLWIAPLRDEVKAALTNAIRRAWAGLSTNKSELNESTPTIDIDVERLESVPSQKVLLQIAWRITVVRQSKNLTANCETVSRNSIGEGIPALVRGYQEAFSDVGIQIAKGLVNLMAEGENSCGTR